MAACKLTPCQGHVYALLLLANAVAALYHTFHCTAFHSIVVHSTGWQSCYLLCSRYMEEMCCAVLCCAVLCLISPVTCAGCPSTAACIAQRQLAGARSCCWCGERPDQANRYCPAGLANSPAACPGTSSLQQQTSGTVAHKGTKNPVRYFCCAARHIQCEPRE